MKIKMQNPQGDILEKMTKAELINWIRRNVWSKKPRWSEVLFERWKDKTKILAEEEEAEAKRFSDVDFKKCDELAKQFNASKDINERSRIIGEMEPYEKSLQDYLQRSEDFRARGREIDKLYQAYEKAAEQERKQGAA